MCYFSEKESERKCYDSEQIVLIFSLSLSQRLSLCPPSISAPIPQPDTFLS